MKRLLLLVLAQMIAQSVAFADQFVPMVRCEQGKVVLDKILNDSGNTIGFQLVGHGGLAHKVAEIDARGASFYDGGATSVIRVDLVRDFYQGTLRGVTAAYVFTDSLKIERDAGRSFDGMPINHEENFNGCHQ